MSPADAATPLLRAARVRRTHGVRGAVRVENLGDDPRRFLEGLVLIVEATGEEVIISDVQIVADNELLMGFRGIESPEAAQPLRGAYLCVPTENARRLGDDQWFVWQLVGLVAVDTEGERIGTVDDVEPGSVHDVLVVDTPSGLRRFPMVRAFVQDVDVAAGRIVLSPWEEE